MTADFSKKAERRRNILGASERFKHHFAHINEVKSNYQQQQQRKELKAKMSEVQKLNLLKKRTKEVLRNM